MNYISCHTGSNDLVHYKKIKVKLGYLDKCKCYCNPLLNVDALSLFTIVYTFLYIKSNKTLITDHFKPCPLSCNILFYRFGSRDCGFAVEDGELDVFSEARQVTDLCGDPDIEEYLQQAVEENGLQQPQDWKTASELYITLKEIAGL